MKLTTPFRFTCHLFLILSLAVSLTWSVTAGEVVSDSTFALIDEWGGKLSVGADKLTVPEGALDGPTELSMTIHTGECSIGFEFGPHGTVFNVPVQLELSWSTMRDVDAEDIVLYYYNDETGEWQEETSGVWDTRHKKVTLELNHFSAWFKLD